MESDRIDAAVVFARHFARARFEELPPEVVRIAKHQILDTLGVAVAGFGQPGAAQVLELAAEWGGAQQASVIGTPLKLPAPNAAQVNTTMAHARDYDDVHERAVMHPGIVSIFPALAAAELRAGLSGRELLAAVVLGSDLVCRLGFGTRPGVSPIHTGWHFTTLYGFPTAALVAGRVLGLDEERLVHAFGLAYHQSSGNGQCVIDGSLAKRLGPGMAVRGGIVAALLARKGVTGARDSLEGPNGLFAVYHRGEYDREQLVGELGRRYEGGGVTLKPYPCCRGVHASIDAALEISAGRRIDAARVREIEITTGSANHELLCTPIDAKVRPRNPVDTQFSIPWGVAVALGHGRVAMEHFTAQAIADANTSALAAKIRTGVDPALSSPRGVEPARVRVVFDDGSVRETQVDLARGSPEKPMSFDDCVRKFDDCIAFAGGWMAADRAAAAVELVTNLEQVDDVRELIALFARSGAG